MPMYPYYVQMTPNVRLLSEGDDLLLACTDGRGLRSRNPCPGHKILLEGLAQGGKSPEQLIDCAMAADPQADPARLYYLLAIVENKGFLSYTVAVEGVPLMTLEPSSPSFRFTDSACPGSLRLSRFACLRRDGEVLVMESPLAHARLLLHNAGLGALPALLAAPRTMDELVAALPDYTPSHLTAAVALLVSGGVAFPCDDQGRIAEETDPALRLWEFHDLFFHTRSRSGRHAQPLGGTFRFKNELAHAPALKPAMSTNRIMLDRPAEDEVGPAFFAVLAERSSRREQGEPPMSLAQLAEFLWHSARVQTHVPAAANQPESYEHTLRPYPSGGAIHDLELYLIVTRCTGLEPGLYHYDPLAHVLERLADLGEKQQRLVRAAMRDSAMKQPPDILITLATRFGRIAWKYESIAYSLSQKNVGCLYQQMYLVATALGLASCALGRGNSDDFAEATGLDFYEETSVGEFMLSSRVG